MKKILYILSLSLMFGCNYESNNLPELPPDGENVPIVLSAGADMVAKAGARENDLGFLTGDAIGVTAYYSNKLVATSPNLDTPNFTQEPLFGNAKATVMAENETKPEGLINKFAWGTTKYYPQGKKIFMFAYYPYNDGVTSTEGVKFVRKNTVPDTYDGPDKLEVVLQNETMTESTKTTVQPDVMVARNLNSVNRNSTTEEVRLDFKHLLSKVQFYVKKSATDVGNVEFVSMKFVAPAKAVFEIGEPAAYSGLSTDEADVAKYEVVRTPIALKSDVGVGAFTVPIMVLPYTIDVLKTCKLSMVVNFPYYGQQKFENIDLSPLVDGLTQGALNKITITVSKVEISLSATVDIWAAGSEFEIPVK